jgi:hypothetical protein
MLIIHIQVKLFIKRPQFINVCKMGLSMLVKIFIIFVVLNYLLIKNIIFHSNEIQKKITLIYYFIYFYRFSLFTYDN